MYKLAGFITICFLFSSSYLMPDTINPPPLPPYPLWLPFLPCQASSGMGQFFLFFLVFFPNFPPIPSNFIDNQRQNTKVFFFYLLIP